MKAFKLFLIALLVAGAVAGLLLLSGNGDAGEKSTSEQETLYSKTYHKLRENWDAWDLSQYTSDYTMLNKLKDQLGSHYYKSLLDHLNEMANKQLYNAIKAEFGKTNCQRSEIERLMGEMNRFLTYAEGFDKDEKIKEMKATYKLYSDALALANAKIGRMPTFDMETNSFEPSFRKEKEKLMGRVRNIRNSEFYRNISNIEDVQNALDDVERQVDEAEDKAMTSLARQIVNAYRNSDADDLNTLRRNFSEIRRKYNDEFAPKTNDLIDNYLRMLREASE